MGMIVGLFNEAIICKVQRPMQQPRQEIRSFIGLERYCPFRTLREKINRVKWSTVFIRLSALGAY